MYPHSSIGFVSGGTVSVQLWSSSSHAAEGQAPLSSAEALLCDMNGTLVDPAPIELMRVRMEEGGVTEASSHVPRIADFTTR
nr:hypothetical protein [Actinomyces oris]